MKRILILGASGTVGSAIWKRLSKEDDFKMTGTYFSAVPKDTSSMIRFSVESAEDICPILEQVRPDIVISCLRGDFAKQLAVHELTADFLMNGNGRIIFISSANVFDGSCEKPHYETDTRISVSSYGQFKIKCEDILKARMGERAVVLRIPFVWGKDSPRMRSLKDGCENGRMEVYTEFFSNHAADLQIAEMTHWIIRENQSGIFHVGTSDVVDYEQFIKRLTAAIGMEKPEWVPVKEEGIMAVLSKRDDIPDALKWDSERLIRYLAD